MWGNVTSSCFLVELHHSIREKTNRKEAERGSLRARKQAQGELDKETAREKEKQVPRLWEDKENSQVAQIHRGPITRRKDTSTHKKCERKKKSIITWTNEKIEIKAKGRTGPVSRTCVSRCRFSHSPVPNRRGGRAYILEAACDWQLVDGDGPITGKGEGEEGGGSEMGGWNPRNCSAHWNATWLSQRVLTCLFENGMLSEELAGLMRQIAARQPTCLLQVWTTAAALTRRSLRSTEAPH